MSLQQASVLIQAIAAVLTLIAILVALFGDLLRARFHMAPEARLKLEVLGGKGYHHGWIDGAVDNSAERVKVHFFRARVTNVGVASADSVAVSLAHLECLSDQTRAAIENTAMPLRWSDSWLFIMGNNGRLRGGPANTTLSSLPYGSSRYCDICFFYDLGCSHEILGASLNRKRAYLATENLPSNTYSLASGRYRIQLHLSALNAKPITLLFEVDINWDIADPRNCVLFKYVSEI